MGIGFSGAGVLMMLLIFGGLIALIVWGIGQTSGGNRSGGNRASEILEERFARGEIDQQDFELRRRELER
jgi:putative membrane protein